MYMLGSPLFNGKTRFSLPVITANKTWTSPKKQSGRAVVNQTTMKNATSHCLSWTKVGFPKPILSAPQQLFLRTFELARMERNYIRSWNPGVSHLVLLDSSDHDLFTELWIWSYLCTRLLLIERLPLLPVFPFISINQKSKTYQLGLTFLTNQLYSEAFLLMIETD